MHRGCVSENAGEAAQHPLRPADDRRAHLSVSLVEPTREADAPGHGIQFRDSETVFRYEKVRTDDARYLVL